VIGDYLIIGLPARSRFGEGRCLELGYFTLLQFSSSIAHIPRHISSIDDQGCMPHHPGVIDLTVVCNDHNGIEPLKKWFGERRGIQFEMVFSKSGKDGDEGS